MNNGCINGYLLSNCSTRTEAVDYLSNLDIEPEQKNAFYKYWKGTKAMQKIALQLKENKRLARLRR